MRTVCYTYAVVTELPIAARRYVSVDNYTCNVARERNASAESECAIRNYYADSRGVAFPYVISLYGYYYLCYPALLYCVRNKSHL